MLNRDQLMYHAANVDNVEQQLDLFRALGKAKKKLHLDVWDAVTDNPSSIRVESSGRAHNHHTRGITPDGPIEFRLESKTKEVPYIDQETHETKSRMEKDYNIHTDVSWEGHLLIFVDDQLKFDTHGNRVLISRNGCF